MRIPRDVSGDDLIKRLADLGYVPTRQSGSHVRLTRNDQDGSHSITVPLHASLRVGTLNSILNDVASHLSIAKEDLLRQLFS
ncbi:MAG: type II toxin-antitoxin system HicA family toxin [Caldilineaceae bacterium]|nr:type II toxin-antitoxin system HicA family toxin [Caldilineaceae bacterium]